MRILKQILTYFMWTLVAFAAAFTYTRIILGSKPEPSKGFAHLLEVIYDLALFHVVLIIGSSIALLFILMDVFYLNKKLKNNSKKTILRFLVIVVITLVAAVIHISL